MSDTAIRNALRRRDELAHEAKHHEDALKTIKAQIDEVERFITAWHDFADESDKEAVGIPKKTPPAPSGGRPSNPRKEEVADHARQIILERGHPIGRTELFNALAERGVVLQGKNPEVILSTMLWRMKEKIVRLQPYGYWVADRPYEKAGYDPNDSENAGSQTEAQI